MVSAKMKRRLKRRTKSPLYTQIPQQHSDRSVNSPPRLRRDNSPPTTEFTFSLDVDPVVTDIEQGTISTVTNDVAFRERVGRRCGFDEMGYSRSNSGGSGNKNGGKQVKRHSPQQLVKEESYLYQSGTKKTNRTAASPMGVNELDFTTAQFEWTDKVSTKQSPHSTKLNLKRSMRKDDDTFFYSESAPSEATTDTKLVGEEITLGSSSSYLQSFDILENRKVERLGHQMGRGSPIRYSGSGVGSGGLSQRKEVEEVVAALEADPVVVEAPPPPPPAVTPELAPQQLQPQPPIETSPRTQSQPTNNSNNAIAITDNNESNNNNNDDKKAAEAGCAVPEVLQEFVNDIQSVLTQAISVAYLACSESEQCLSRFQGEGTTEKVQSNPPLNSKKSMLDTIDEGHEVASKSNETKSPNNKGKVWTGDYLNKRTGTEETAENSSQEGGERSAEGGRTNRLRKFLSLVKSRK